MCDILMLIAIGLLLGALSLLILDVILCECRCEGI